MDKNNYWLSIIFSTAAISSGFSVLIPLYILDLHGNVIDVSVATTAYALAVIPASLLWGELTQRLNKIKVFMMLSFLSTLPIIFLLYFLHSILLAIIMYAVYAFVITASSPAINIMILNKRRNTVLRSYYGIYGLLSITGNIIGYIPGVLLFSFVVSRYLLILFAFNIASIVFTMLFVKETKMSGEINVKKKKEIHGLFPLLNSISKFPQILAGQHLIMKLAEISKRKTTRRIFTLFAAISFFNFGMYLFNTSYIPFLDSYKISFSNIFLINMFNAVGQFLIYFMFMMGRTKGTLRHYYRLSSLIRSAGYLVAIVSIPLIIGAFYLNAFSYFLAGIGYAMWNISSSVIIYVNIAGKMEAHYIGIWSALIGLSGVVGALFSGLISFYSGYISTFIISIFFTLFSIVIFNNAYHDGEKIKDFGNKI